MKYVTIKHTLQGGLISLAIVGLLVGIWYLLSPVKSSEVTVVQPSLEDYNTNAFVPIPLDAGLDLDPQKVALGERLFHEKSLSRDNTISCASCHDLQNGGVDGLPFSVGIDGQMNTINTQTVFGSSLDFRQFWNGRAANLEEQVAEPMHNPVKMGSNWAEVIAKLNADSYYLAAFSKLYGGIDAPSVEDAIATFERTLITKNSSFDRYLRGDMDALTADEKEGYRLFKDYGCSSCHQGVNVGGNMYHKLGVMRDYFTDRGNLTEADQGRYLVTHDIEDMHVFKVPSLRMVARTAPYFHDGTVPDLESAVTLMGYYQLGIDLPDADVRKIVQFLHTLVGQYQGKPL